MVTVTFTSCSLRHAVAAQGFQLACLTFLQINKCA